jgi:hypothetical protein
VTVLFGLLFMIHLRGQGLVMTLRRIWSIEAYKDVGDFEVGYDYLEDFEETAAKVVAVKDEIASSNLYFDFEDIFNMF